VTIKRLEKQV